VQQAPACTALPEPGIPVWMAIGGTRELIVHGSWIVPDAFMTPTVPVRLC
jgi:hypothetical protein